MPEPQKSSVEFTRCALSALHTLDGALANHFDWLKVLHRTLICNGPSNPADRAEDAHCSCQFGQWYYGEGQVNLGQEPGFQAIEAKHHEMHILAARLLARHDKGQLVDRDEYDAFMEVAIGFKQSVRLFQYEIMNRICVVDQLTGVWNRHAMNLRLAEELERIHRGGRTGILCMMDIDHFKRVNDAHGHRVGDVVLQEVAGFFSRNLRIYDAVFRFGGEEFLICLPDTELLDAKNLLDRLRGELANLEIVSGESAIKVSASLGLAVLGPRFGVEETIEWADRALLMAKAGGRNRVCVWDGVQPHTGPDIV